MIRTTVALIALALFSAATTAQTVATCPTGSAGVPWAAGAWLPCTPAAVYVPLQPPATAKIAHMSCPVWYGKTGACVSAWDLPANILPTDGVWAITAAAPTGQWVKPTTIGMGTATVPPVILTNATAHLSWVAPTLNTDGTPLTNLKAFTIYQNGIKIGSVTADILKYDVTALAPGTYAFGVTAVNADGVASDAAAAPTATVSPPVVTPKTPTAPGSVSVTITVNVP